MIAGNPKAHRTPVLIVVAILLLTLVIAFFMAKHKGEPAQPKPPLHESQTT